MLSAGLDSEQRDAHHVARCTSSRSSPILRAMTDMSVSAARNKLADVKVAEHGTLFLETRPV